MGLRVTVAILAVTCLSLPALAQEVPEDFSLVLASARRPARVPGDTEWVSLAADGRMEMSAALATRGLLPADRIQLSNTAVLDIYQSIQEQQFFALSERYSDDEIMDGDLVVLEVRAGGATHRVTAVNIGVNALDEIVAVINQHLPGERQISYNALHVEGYKRVQR